MWRTNTRQAAGRSCSSYLQQQALTWEATPHRPTRNYLLLYGPICLPYRSPIDRGKPTLYAVDHKHGVHGHLLLYSDRSGSRCPASTIGLGETNTALLTHLSVQPWQAHKIPLMSSCLREWIHFSEGFIHRGKKIKINGFLCTATVCNCLSEGDCLQSGNVMYANVTWKWINGFSQNDCVLTDGLSWGFKSVNSGRAKTLKCLELSQSAWKRKEAISGP